MKRGATIIAAAMLAISACDQQARRQPTSNPAESARNVAPPDAPASVSPRTTDADPKTSLAEPKSMIDPKSAEAAGQVVQLYGALMEQRRWTEAGKLWGDKKAAARFAAELENNREVHLGVGDLGNTEGAAGSIYITVPITVYGKDANGRAFKALRTVILRRVNDVPGSTEEQRRWHIVGWETGREPKGR